MAFDGARGNPASPPPSNDPPEWLDFLARLIGVGMFATLYVAWLVHTLGSAWRAGFGS